MLEGEKKESKSWYQWNNRLCLQYVYCIRGLIKYMDTKAKCRHLKNLTCKETLRQMIIRVYFPPRFVNFCPSNLISGSTLTPPPPCVNKYTVYTLRIHCVRGRVWGSGPQADKHLPQSLFTGQFFRWRHFALHSVSLIFLRLYCNLYCILYWLPLTSFPLDSSIISFSYSVCRQDFSKMSCLHVFQHIWFWVKENYSRAPKYIHML
jgi:hypothetical protein